MLYNTRMKTPMPHKPQILSPYDIVPGSELPSCHIAVSPYRASSPSVCIFSPVHSPSPQSPTTLTPHANPQTAPFTICRPLHPSIPSLKTSPLTPSPLPSNSHSSSSTSLLSFHFPSPSPTPFLLAKPPNTPTQSFPNPSPMAKTDHSKYGCLPRGGLSV